MKSCGDPEPVLNQNVAEELKLLLENNAELTPSLLLKSRICAPAKITARISHLVVDDDDGG